MADNSTPAIAFFLNDWPVDPHGINAGGGKFASLSVAREFRKMGKEVFIFANLPKGDCEVDGIKFRSFGANYDLKSALGLSRDLGCYHAFAASLPHPFLLIMDDPNCVSRILVNHAPSAIVGGLEPHTVLGMADYIVCVSQAQAELLKTRLQGDGSRIAVVKNGFDPELVPYHGPEERNWRRLLFAGRISLSKGVNNLIEAFITLKQEFPDLELRLCGDPNYWPDLARQVPQLEARFAGLKFLGAQPHAGVISEMQSAGLFVFPSVTFETAGLTMIEAQASGCPVVATPVGGIPEYLVSDRCGILTADTSALALYHAIGALLRDPERLKQMSRNCAESDRNRTWKECALELSALAERRVR